MILLVPVVLVVLFSIIALFVRNYLAGWYALLFIAAVNYALGPDSARFAGIHIYPMDMINACLLISGAIRSRIWEIRFNALSIAVLAYVGMFLVSLARGFAVYGLTTAGNEARGFISEIVAVTYFITVPHDREVVRKIIRAEFIFAGALMGLVLLHYAGVPVGVDMAALGPTNTIDRAIQAQAAASFVISLVFATSWWLDEDRRGKWVFPAIAALTGAIVVLQHRTVWAMLTVVLLLAFFMDREVLRILLKALALSTVAGLAVLVASSDIRTRLFENLEVSATNSGTFTWRVQSWERSLENDGGVVDVLIGQPMGSGYNRLDTDIGTYTDVVPHNEFVNQYLRLGVLGTFLLIVIMLRPFRTLWYEETEDLLLPNPTAWFLVCAAVFTFGIPYAYPGELIALIAMANGLTSSEFAHEQEAAFEDPEADDPDDAELDPIHQPG